MIALAREYPAEQRCRPAWHDGFLELLPAIRSQLRFALRRLSPDDRAEAMAECIASIAAAYARLHAQGKCDVAFASSLADFAVRHYFAGRRIGDRLNGNDVMSPYAQRQRGFCVKSLDQRNPAGEWKEIVVEDGRATPAEVAASRIDIADWLDQLPRRKREVAQALATGESTTGTASRCGVTPGRVAQLRKELAESWAVFQSEALAFA